MSYENRKAWVQRMFESYGFTPPPGVIDALTSTIPTDDQAGIASQEVGAYINAFNELQKAAASDPLQKLLIDENMALTSAGVAAEGYASQVQDVYKQAPKLFGALTPDQIDQYLAPAKSAFDYDLGKVSGEAAARGVTGSSLEATAMAQAQKQFQDQTLQTGLTVGMTEQQNLANVLQNLYNQKLQQQNLLYGIQQGTAGQISQQGYQNAEFLAQLPILLQGNAVQAAAMNQNRSSTPWGAIGSAAGMGLGALLAAPTGGLSIPMGMALGGMAGGAAGQTMQGFAGGNNTMATGGMSTLNMLPLLYGSMNKGSGAPAGMNWGTQPGQPQPTQPRQPQPTQSIYTS